MSMVGAVAPLTAARGSIVREIAIGAARDAAAANILANAADQGDVLAAAFSEEAQELLGCAAVRRARAARIRAASAEATTLGLHALGAIGADAALLEDREADRVEGSVIQAVRETHSPGVFGYVSPEEQRLLSRKSKLERMTSGQLEQSFNAMLTRMYDSAANYGADGDEDEEVEDNTVDNIGVAADLFGGDLPAVFGDGVYGSFWDLFRPSKDRLIRRLEKNREKLAKVEAKLEELEDADKGGLRVRWLRGRVKRLEKKIVRIKGKLEKMGVSAAKVARSQVDADKIERAETEKVRESVDPDGSMSEAMGAYGADDEADDLADEDLLAAIDVFGMTRWRKRRIKRRITKWRDKRMTARSPRQRRRLTRKIRRHRRYLARGKIKRGGGRRRAWRRAGKPLAKVPMKPRHIRYLQERRIRAAARRMPPRPPYQQPMYALPTAMYPEAAPASAPPPPMPYEYPSYDEMPSTLAMPQASPPEPTDYEAQDIQEGDEYEEGKFGYNVEDDPTFAAEIDALEDEYGLDDDDDLLGDDDDDLLDDDDDLLGDDDDDLLGDDDDLLGDDDDDLLGELDDSDTLLGDDDDDLLYGDDDDDDDDDEYGYFWQKKSKRQAAKKRRIINKEQKAADLRVDAGELTAAAAKLEKGGKVAPGEAPPGGGPSFGGLWHKRTTAEKVADKKAKAARKLARAADLDAAVARLKKATSVAPGEAPPGGGPTWGDDDDIIYGDDSDLLGDIDDPDSDLDLFGDDDDDDDLGVLPPGGSWDSPEGKRSIRRQKRAQRKQRRDSRRAERGASGAAPAYPDLATEDEEAGRQVFVGFFHRRCAKHGGANIDTNGDGFGGFWDKFKSWWSNLTSAGAAKAQAAAQQRREVSAARREARKPMDPAVVEWKKGLRLSKRERRKLGKKAARAARGKTPRAERGPRRAERGPRRSTTVKQAAARVIQDDGGWTYQQNPDGSIKILEAPPAGARSVGMTYQPGSDVVEAVTKKFGPPGSATVGATWTGPRGGTHRTWVGPRGVARHLRIGPRGRVVRQAGGRWARPWARRRAWRRSATWAMPYYGDDEYGAGLFSTLIATGMSNRDKASFLAKELDSAIKKFGPESQITALLKGRLDDVSEDARVLGPDSAAVMDEDEDLDFDEIESGMKGSFAHYG